MSSLPIVFTLRRIALLTATISILTYPALGFTMTRIMPNSDLSITGHVLSVAPYGVALSVALVCLSQHISYRQRAKRDPNTSTLDYLLATTVHTIIWTAATLVSIPVTTTLLILSSFLLS